MDCYQQGLLLHVFVFVIPFEIVPRQMSVFVLFSIQFDVL